MLLVGRSCDQQTVRHSPASGLAPTARISASRHTTADRRVIRDVFSKAEKQALARDQARFEHPGEGPFPGSRLESWLAGRKPLNGGDRVAVATGPLAGP